MAEEKTGKEKSDAAEPVRVYRHGERPHLGAYILILLGVLFLINEFVPELNFGRLWPLILIALGIGILARGQRR